MTIARHLPIGSEHYANEQGWNAESLVILLSGFIVSKKLEAELADHLAEAAAAENANLEDEDEDEEEDDMDDPE